MGVFDILDGEDNQTNQITTNRRTFLTGAATATGIALAGCTDTNNNEETTSGEDTTDETNTDFSIQNIQLNGEPLQEYEVEIPRDASPEALASEFEHQLTYQTNGTDQPIQSTITAQYTDNTIPEEDPLNETLTDQQVEPGNVQQTVQFPNQLTEDLIENPRNIQATLTTQTQNNQTEERQFTLNYADQYAEQIHREAFESDQTSFGNVELISITVEDGIIDLEYSSDHALGSEEFNQDISSGIYAGVVGTTRIPYELDYTVHDSEGDTYQFDLGSDVARNHLSEDFDDGDLARQIYFEEGLKPE